MTDEPQVRAHHGKVLIPNGDSDDEYTPDAARQLLRELIAAINEADWQVVAIRNACAEGHEWGEGWNLPWTEKTTRYDCTRPGCDGHKDEPGWLPFEPKDHHVPYAGVVPCTGPGCEHCDDEAMALQLQAFWDEAFAGTVERALGNRRFDPAIFPGANAQPAHDLGVPTYRDGDTGQIITQPAEEQP